MRIFTSLPDHIQPRAGEEIEFAAIVQSDGSLQVTHILKRHSAALAEAGPPPRLMDWVGKWAGTMEMKSGETRESLRHDFMVEKFGSLGEPE